MLAREFAGAMTFPLFSDPAPKPATNYPALLHRVTLQDYLGETLAVLAVEHWGPTAI